MNRKEFIKKAFRIGILGGLTGGTLFLVTKNRIDYTCSVDGVCKSCSLLSSCDLEKAKESKKDER